MGGGWKPSCIVRRPFTGSFLSATREGSHVIRAPVKQTLSAEWMDFRGIALAAAEGDRGAALRRRGKAVAPHNFGDRRRIGRTAGSSYHDGRDFAEVIRAEDARSHNREHRRVGGARVVEAVDRPASDAKNLARADVGSSPFHGESQYALKSVDCLLVGVMTVRDRHFRSSRDIELEHRDGPSRRLALEQEANCQPPNPDLFSCARHDELLPPADDRQSETC